MNLNFLRICLSAIAITIVSADFARAENYSSIADEIPKELNAQIDHWLVNDLRQIKKIHSNKKAEKLPATINLYAADGVITPLPDTGSAFPGDINFPTDPINDPGMTDPIGWDPNLPPMMDDFYQYSSITKSGAAERLALEVLFQTFKFYGVKAIVKKVGAQIDLQIVESKKGYLTNLTKLEVAYAIREFSRYLTALLCNLPTIQNYYRAFAQVPLEEIGLRFKYDMAWALLGNSLPREPNAIFAMGTRWKALQQIVTSSNTFREPSTQNKELRSWASNITDIVNVLTRINKIMCFVDIRPDPKEELKKRVVVSKFMEMEKRLNERYGEYKVLIDSANKQGRQSQINSLKTP